jgi:hypothetical protein
LAVKSFESSTSAFAGSQAAQQSVSWSAFARLGSADDMMNAEASPRRAFDFVCIRSSQNQRPAPADRASSPISENAYMNSSTLMFSNMFSDRRFYKHCKWQSMLRRTAFARRDRYRSPKVNSGANREGRHWLAPFSNAKATAHVSGLHAVLIV